MSIRWPVSMAPSVGETSAESRNDLLGEQLERREAAVALEDALAEQEEHLVERDVAGGVLDHAADRVDVADEERGPVLAERRRPRVPHPETILGPRLGLAPG